jgi:hypothetical protein
MCIPPVQVHTDLSYAFYASGDFQFGKQGPVVGGDAGEIIVAHVDAENANVRPDEDMIDAEQRKMTAPGTPWRARCFCLDITQARST